MLFGEFLTSALGGSFLPEDFLALVPLGAAFTADFAVGFTGALGPCFVFDAGLAEAFVIAFGTGLGLAGAVAFLAGVFTTAFFDAGDGLTTFAALDATTFFVWVADFGVDLTEGLVTGLAAILEVDF